MDLGLSGAVVVVTGASQGIGQEIAVAFASEGAKVAAIARTASGLAHTRELASKVGAGNVHEFVCDIRDESQVVATLAAVGDELGSPDVVVNNAGARQLFGELTRLSLQDWEEALASNLMGALLVTKATLGRMIERGSGCFVNIGSIAGTRPIGRIAAYSVAKSGLHALTRAVAYEGAANGVRANVIAPGWIETPMNHELRTDKRLRSSLEAIVEGIPMRRFGKPADISSLALFLASPLSAYITGQIYHVDGGVC